MTQQYYKWEPCYTIEEVIAFEKSQNRERAKKIPELLRKKECEYV